MTPAPTESSNPVTTPIAATPAKNISHEDAADVRRSATTRSTIPAMKQAPILTPRVARRPSPEVDILESP